ncbi:MAG: N-acetylglucosamine-6-phosphate deacetylase [Anaerolineae bacterium]
MLTIRGRHYLSGEWYDFSLADGIIQAIRPASGSEGYWVAPGLIDLQVNGYAGYDFCSAQVTPGEVAAAAHKLAEAGVTAFCPTVTTNAFPVMAAGLRAIAQACKQFAAARERILTIHLEGPYLAPEDGPRGAHPREHVRPPDWEEFSRLQAAASGRIGLITLAPELPGALEFIAKARAAGVRVALGHHAANREQLHAAVAAGAIMSTHLGNGAHAQLPRHPNYLWEQLAHDGLLASIIVDGHHLPPAVVKTIFRTKEVQRLILVSDAVWVAGLPPGRYRFMGGDVELRPDQSVHLVGTPYLAGSALKLADGVNHIIHFAGATLAQAVEMASTNPAKLLGQFPQRGCLQLGARADLTLFRTTAAGFELAGTVVGGVVEFAAQNLPGSSAL